MKISRQCSVWIVLSLVSSASAGTPGAVIAKIKAAPVEDRMQTLGLNPDDLMAAQFPKYSRESSDLGQNIQGPNSIFLLGQTAAWKRNPGTYLMIMFLSPKGGCHPSGVTQISYFKKTGNAYEFLATAPLTPVEGTDQFLVGKCEFGNFLFDFARYRLSEALVAFGVRDVGAHSETLHLFTYENGKLAEVLTRKSMSRARTGNLDCPELEEASVYRILKSQTQSRFDILETTQLSCTNHATPKGPKSRTTTLKWTGREYQPQ